MVRVINLKGKGGRAFWMAGGFIYVGRQGRHGLRPHPLRNPFKEGEHGTRAECVAKFALWLDGKIACPKGRWVDPAWLAAELARLAEQVRSAGLPLACWCVDWGGEGEPAQPCHAVVLARRLQPLLAP